MIREEVVFYLKSNLGKFPLSELKAQLLSEGVSEEEIKSALKAAKRAQSRERFGRFLMILGGVALFSSLVFIFLRPTRPPLGVPVTSPVFISHFGYTLHIPDGYEAIIDKKTRRRETVFFCQKGTDPSTFLDQSLYGELGILRLKVLPNPFPNDLSAFNKLSRIIESKARTNGSPFHLEPLSISGMPGLEVIFDAPASKTLTYVLGAKNLYIFLTGPSNPNAPIIIKSLREI